MISSREAILQPVCHSADRRLWTARGSPDAWSERASRRFGRKTGAMFGAKTAPAGNDVRPEPSSLYGSRACWLQGAFIDAVDEPDPLR
jgi:hypothetical protein